MKDIKKNLVARSSGTIGTRFSQALLLKKYFLSYHEEALLKEMGCCIRIYSLDC